MTMSCSRTRLFPPPSDLPAEQRSQPDWALVHRELRRPDVTLTLLWEEYRDSAPDGFSYSWFCELYKDWAGRLKPTLRQVHVAGEKLFVDYRRPHHGGDRRRSPARSARSRSSSPCSGPRATPMPRPPSPRACRTGSARTCAPLPSSAAPRARRSATISRPAITKACFHEPMVNRTYADMARHYGTAILPARPYKPRDKAKVEVGVQVVGRWILARLRNRRFFSLPALNEAIRDLLRDLNDRPMRGWGRSRRELFETARSPGPPAAAGRTLRVCRVEALPGRPRLPRRDRQAFLQRAAQPGAPGGRGADHGHHASKSSSAASVWPRIVRSHRPHRPTTVAEHMPSSHRRYRDWTHERIRREAGKVGSDAATLIDVILRSQTASRAGLPLGIGILGLVRRYGAERVDAACARALAINTRSYTSVAAILKSGTPKASQPTPDAPVLVHANIRGPGYYH